QGAINAFLKMPSGRCLLEQDTHRPLDIRISRTLSEIEVVKAFLRVIQRPDLIQVLGVVGSYFFGQLKVFLGRQRMVTARHAGLEEVSAVGSHFMEVQYDIGLPRSEEH